MVTKVVRFEEAVVDQRTAEESGFPAGEQVYNILRVRYLDGKPLILDYNLFLKSLVPGLTAEIAERSNYAVIIKRTITL